jgi:hypothetical protein
MMMMMMMMTMTYTPMLITWGRHQFKLPIFLAVTPMNCHVTWREKFNASVRMRSR